MDLAWPTLCRAAWSLGFTELHLTPKPNHMSSLPERHSFVPLVTGPETLEAAPSLADATWSVERLVGGDVVAEMVARRPLDDVDFDPLRFAAVVEGLVARHLSVREGATVV